MLHRAGLPGFRGNLDWIHSFEGHAGKPYWPGGASGITLDAGFDLGYADESLFMALYAKHLTHARRQACLDAMGTKGRDAYEYLRKSEVLQNVNISFKMAQGVFPHIAASYWGSLLTRFPALVQDEVPDAVQTVMLSLAINRGPGNPDLKRLRLPLASGDWKEIGTLVEEMQQDHDLRGIQKRRREEGAYIKTSIREAKYEAMRQTIDRIEARPPQEFNIRPIEDIAAEYEIRQ